MLKSAFSAESPGSRAVEEERILRGAAEKDLVASSAKLVRELVERLSRQCKRRFPEGIEFLWN